MSESESRKLSELRVVDLKLELEKRGLDKSGVKQVLIDRLHKALVEEGEDPESFGFKSTDDKPPEKPLKRPSLSGKSDSDKTESEETGSDSEKGKAVMKSEVQNESKKAENGAVDDGNETVHKEEDHETPITLTLEEEEKIHDEECVPESTPQKDKSNSDEKKSTNEETKEEKGGVTDSEAMKKEGTESASGADGKKVPSNANPRAIWISNVAMNTRACDIKQALSQYGKVVGAKVVVNAKYPGTCCFGYVTMGTVEDASKVIDNLNNTELNGQIIKIEKFDVVRGEQLKQIKNGRKSPERSKSSSRKGKSPAPISKSPKDDESKTSKSETKDKENSKEGEGEETQITETEESEKQSDEKSEKGKDAKSDKAEKSSDEKKRHSSSGRKSRDRKRTASRDRPGNRSRSREKKQGEILTFDKIREARERQRLREKERMLREDARRRHEETMRQREIERRQRSEAQRLEREREKLRIEREKIEREKNELIRLERERQKIERERIELEKMELQRTRIRLEEDRRAVKRPAPYRRDDSFDDRKRPSDGRHFNEAPPPPPHFDSSSKLHDNSTKKFPSKDYKSPYEKRDIPDKRPNRDYDSDRSRPSSSSMNRPSTSVKFEGRPYEGIRDRDLHDRNRDSMPSVSSRVSKDHRFDRERERSPHYRPGERRVAPDGKPKMSTSTSRLFTGPTTEMPRFDSRSSSSWSASTTPKPFNNSSSSKWPAKEDNWRPGASSERWNTSGRNPNFNSNSNMNVVPTCPPPPGINNYPDRFDYTKIPSSVRKY